VNAPAHQMGAVASARLRQITIIVAVESVIWRTGAGIATTVPF
jgi:hypothetical protein